jgi:serralysin
VVYGNQGADLVYGNPGADTLFGGQDADTLFGGQDADVVYGNLGNDVVYGNLGADILYGGRGDDVLVGGQGDDILVGGLGADLYRFDANSGRDLILGFDQAAGDRLDLQGQSYTLGTAADGSAQLTLAGGGLVDLAGVRADQINASYFAA